VTPPPARLHRLLVRYWDHTLSDAEAAELFAALKADPAARDLLRQFGLEAVAAADGSAVAMPALAGAPPRRPSRRRWLGLAAAAAGAGAVALTRPWEAAPPAGVVLAQVLGRVRVGAAVATAGTVLRPGDTVSTEGVGSVALFAYPNGVRISLANDSVLTLGDTVRQMVLRDGTATAGVPPQPAGADPFVLATTELSLDRPSGVVMSLGRAVRAWATEVSVHHGRVDVSGPDGESLGDVRRGEVLTVRAGGGRTKESLADTPDEFAWDLSRPLPDDWHVGTLEADPVPVVRPELWYDPFHKTGMYQIRSDKQWARGLFRLAPESVVRVRYRADRAGPGQLCFCTRTPDRQRSDTGMLEWNGTYLPPAAGGGWRWLEVRAGDMLGNPHAPKFGAPWVGFLTLFNTYEADLGLEVAEFRVARPGGPAPGA
jgi:ferric-dicitrate binding protein FerR (iron transport regulator)